jgi:recombination protein RecA
MAPPFREVEFDILYGQGISRAGDIVDLASDLGIVEKSGAWFSFQGERIGQGRENAKAFLKENPAMFAEVRQRVLEKRMAAVEAVGRGRAAPPAKPEADEDEDE